MCEHKVRTCVLNARMTANQSTGIVCRLEAQALARAINRSIVLGFAAAQCHGSLGGTSRLPATSSPHQTTVVGDLLGQCDEPCPSRVDHHHRRALLISLMPGGDREFLQSAHTVVSRTMTHSFVSNTMFRSNIITPENEFVASTLFWCKNVWLLFSVGKYMLRVFVLSSFGLDLQDLAGRTTETISTRACAHVFCLPVRAMLIRMFCPTHRDLEHSKIFFMCNIFKHVPSLTCLWRAAGQRQTPCRTRFASTFVHRCGHIHGCTQCARPVHWHSGTPRCRWTRFFTFVDIWKRVQRLDMARPWTCTATLAILKRGSAVLACADVQVLAKEDEVFEQSARALPVRSASSRRGLWPVHQSSQTKQTKTSAWPLIQTTLH